MTGFPVLLVAGFIVLAIVLAIYGAAAVKKRRQELAAWAAGRGFSFSAERDHSMDERYPNLDILRKGSNRYAYNIAHGSLGAGDGSFGRSVFAFDYHYETHSTDSKGRRQTHHHHFSVVILQTDLPLRPLHIRPEHFFDKVGEFFGMDDIDFESAAFSKRFCVRSPDRRWAFDVITQETMEFLLGAPRYTISMENGRIAVFDKSRFAAPEFDRALAVAEGVLDRLPPSVVRELTERI